MIFSDKPYFQIKIYPPDTENEENKKALKFDFIVFFPRSVRSFFTLEIFYINFLCILYKISKCYQYPEEIPEFVFKNVKGITDDDLKKLNDYYTIYFYF